MRKLKLKKEIIVSLNNTQKAKGGDTTIVIPTWDTLDIECATVAVTQDTNCGCDTILCQTQDPACTSGPSVGCVPASQHCTSHHCVPIETQINPCAVTEPEVAIEV